ncbi:hypothetical protein ISCGN_018373 [Ixodes scapularis]
MVGEMATDCIILVGPSQDTRLREAGAKVACCLTRGAPKGPNLPRVQLNHQDALFPGHGLATHSQTWVGLSHFYSGSVVLPMWLGSVVTLLTKHLAHKVQAPPAGLEVRGDATLQTPAFTALYGALLPSVKEWDPVAQAEALAGGASLTMAFLAQPAGTRPLSWNGSPLFAMRPVSTPPPNEPGRVAQGGGGEGGGFYLNWAGNTLEEPLAAEAARNEGTHAHLARGHYLLPYDFVAFDHQPPRPEIMALQDVLDGVAVDTATAEHRREAELLHWLIPVGHSRATLQAPVGLCSDDVFAVTAGLMSELQTTSSVGSGGKGVLGSRAFGILSRLTCSDVRRSSTLEIRSYRTTSTPLGVKISTTQLEPWLMKPSSDSTEWLLVFKELWRTLPHTLPLVPVPPEHFLFADASNDGLGVVTPSSALAILTTPDPRIYLREAVAWTLAALLAPPSSLIFTDNRALRCAITSGHLRALPWTLTVAMTALTIKKDLRAKWLPTTQNPADMPSRLPHFFSAHSLLGLAGGMSFPYQKKNLTGP